MNLKIPGYELIERLGAGGMASVWKARQVSLDRFVAIKILYSQFSNDPSDVGRFLSEARMTARLKHPGIVQVYDVGTCENMYYIVMEYVAGYTVGAWIERSGVLSAHDCLLTAECIADALHYAWELDQIIHCDIKPHNALIDADGTIKLSDLGLARTLRILHVEEGGNDIMGTPSYMSPEQVMGEHDLDFRSDIYSLGAMLYHMSTGTMPFEGCPDVEVMEMQVRDVLPDPIDVNPDIPTQMAWLIEKMMFKQRGGRHLTWADVMGDIRHVRNGRRPPVMPAEGGSTVGRSPKRIKKKAPIPSRLCVESRKKSPAKYVFVVFVLTAVAFIFAHSRGCLHSSFSVNIKRDDNGKPAEDARPMKSEWTQRIEDTGKLNLKMLGRPYVDPVQDQVKELTTQRGVKIDKLATNLSALAKLQLQSNAFSATEAVLEGYERAYAEGTTEARAQWEEESRRRLAEIDDASIAEDDSRYEAVMDAVVDRLIKGDVTSAREVLEQALKDDQLKCSHANLELVNKELRQANTTDGRIISSFGANIGRTLNVGLRTDKRRMKIVSVNGDGVTGRLVRDDGNPGAILKIKVSQLGFGERLRRMGDDAAPGVALAKGLMALKAGSRTHAERYFQMTEPQLSVRLIKSIKK